MLLQALPLFFLLHFSIGSDTTACPEVVPECPPELTYHERVNQTVQDVLADMNKSITVSREFMRVNEHRMHTFMVDLRVALLTDQRLLERLLYLQKQHGPNFTGHPDFDKECDDYNINKPSISVARKEEPCDGDAAASSGAAGLNGTIAVPAPQEVNCPEAVPECPSDVSFHMRVNQTIRHVLEDIKERTVAAHEFMEEYDRKMHEFVVELRVAMLTDQRLLEQLLLLQQLHGQNFTGVTAFDEVCLKHNVTRPCPTTRDPCIVIIPTPPPSEVTGDRNETEIYVPTTPISPIIFPPTNETADRNETDTETATSEPLTMNVTAVTPVTEDITLATENVTETESPTTTIPDVTLATENGSEITTLTTASEPVNVTAVTDVTPVTDDAVTPTTAVTDGDAGGNVTVTTIAPPSGNNNETEIGIDGGKANETICEPGTSYEKIFGNCIPIVVVHTTHAPDVTPTTAGSVTDDDAGGNVTVTTIAPPTGNNNETFTETDGGKANETICEPGFSIGKILGDCIPIVVVHTTDAPDVTATTAGNVTDGDAGGNVTVTTIAPPGGNNNETSIEADVGKANETVCEPGFSIGAILGECIPIVVVHPTDAPDVIPTTAGNVTDGDAGGNVTVITIDPISGNNETEADGGNGIETICEPGTTYDTILGGCIPIVVVLPTDAPDFTPTTAGNVTDGDAGGNVTVTTLVPPNGGSNETEIGTDGGKANKTLCEPGFSIGDILGDCIPIIVVHTTAPDATPTAGNVTDDDAGGNVTVITIDPISGNNNETDTDGGNGTGNETICEPGTTYNTLLGGCIPIVVVPPTDGTDLIEQGANENVAAPSTPGQANGTLCVPGTSVGNILKNCIPIVVVPPTSGPDVIDTSTNETVTAPSAPCSDNNCTETTADVEVSSTPTTLSPRTPSVEQTIRWCTLLQKVTLSKGSKDSHFNSSTFEYHCSYGMSFFANVSTLSCVVEGYEAIIAYANRTAYTGTLECREYGIAPVTPEEKEKCKACDAHAACRLYGEDEVICSCGSGYSDISYESGLPPGSNCKKCQKYADVDFVMLYDYSGSISSYNRLAFNDFIDQVQRLIFNEEGNNRVAIVPFSEEAEVRVPLTNDIAKTREFLNDTRRAKHLSQNTNTAMAMHVANREIYAKLPSNSTRRRVTLLFTDGRPGICNAWKHQNIVAGLTNKTEKVECFTTELTETRKEMAETHKAEIYVVYVGTLTEEDRMYMKLVHADDDHLIESTDFESLESLVMAKLERKIC